MSSTARRTLSWLALCIVTVAVFHGGLSGDWVRDDVSLIRDNTYVTDPDLAFEALTSSFWTLSGAGQELNPAYATVYRPVVTAAFLAQARLFGLDPYGFHVVNLLLHLACVLLVWQWLRERIPGAEGWPKDAAVTLGAAIFALHPSRGESVAWVSGSTDVWMTLWVLAGLLLWNRRARWRWAPLLCGFLFGLGFLSKEVALVVPALVAVDAWCLGRGRFPVRPFVLLLGSFSVVLAARHLIVPVIAVGSSPSEPLIEILRRASASLGHYVHIALADWTPSVQVALRRALPGGKPYYEPWSVAVGLFTLLVVGVLAAISIRRRGARPWLADVLWFVVPLVPVLNVVDMKAYAMVSERFVYLPMLGICSLVVRAVFPLFERRSPGRAVAVGVSIALLVSYAAVTTVHATHFLSEERLWTYELMVNPDNHAAVQSLERIAWQDERWDEALAYDLRGHQIAVEARESRLAMRFLLTAAQRLFLLTPDSDQATLELLKQAYERYLETNRFELNTETMALDMTTSEAATRDVTADVALFAAPRATVWARTGKLAHAVELTRDILAEHPTQARVWALHVEWLARQGKWDDAIAALRAMKSHLPHHPVTGEVERRLGAAQAIGARSGRSEVAHALRDAEVDALYGARHSARRRLAPWLEKEPGSFDLALAVAKLDAAEGRFTDAEDVLRRGRRAAPPEEHARWDRALRELAALARAKAATTPN